MIEEAIKNFPKQFAFDPAIEREEQLTRSERTVVSGMGGSHLAADLLKAVYPDISLMVHSDYGLPALLNDDFPKTLFVANSYSGNTEEVLDGLKEALQRGILSAAISVGGRLKEIASEHTIPYIALPDTGIQPRSALGFSIVALMKMMGLRHELADIRNLSHVLRPERFGGLGKELVTSMAGHVPIIYSSFRNRSVAYNWKIKANESAKIPAFYNIFSELNHNEMTGFDMIDSTRVLSEKFQFIFLRDSEDDSRTQKRMDVCKKLYSDRGFSVTDVPLEGSSRWERIFNSLLLADWFSYHTALTYGTEPEQVPMVEEFKKLMS